MTKLDFLKRDEKQCLNALLMAERLRREEESQIAFEGVFYQPGDFVTMDIQIEGMLTHVKRTIKELRWSDHFQAIFVTIEEGRFQLGDVTGYAAHITHHE